MKKILVLALCLIVIKAKAQTQLTNGDCPIMVEAEPQYSEWQNIEHLSTVLSNPDWVYDKERAVISLSTPAVYCPCGCNWPSIYTQRRIDRKSGQIQERTKTVYYIPKPSPKSEYQKVLDNRP